jgi:hypothetical protein
MRRFVLTLAAVGLLVLPDVALAQAKMREPREPSRQQQARENTREGRSAPMGDVIRNVEEGRRGRRLDIQPRGSDYVVVWEYPDGRVRNIPVDGRTGRPRED